MDVRFQKTIKSFRIIAIVFIFSAIFSCAIPQAPLTRSEWIAVKTRTYEGMTSDQIFAAVEKLFDLTANYPNDVIYDHSPGKMQILKGYNFIWYIETTRTDTGVMVHVSISKYLRGLFGSYSILPYDKSSDVYRLFYSRLDYLLKLSDQWLSCEDFKKSNPQYTTLEALCGIADNRP